MKKNRHYELLNEIPKSPIVNNVTTFLLLPGLGMNLNNIKISIGKTTYGSEDVLKILGFCQAYSYFPNCPEKYTQEVVYLLFCPSRYSLTNYFPAYYSYITQLETFLGIFVIDIRKIVVVLAVEERWKGVKSKCMKGNYSLMGEKYARHNFNPNEEQFRIIMKVDSKRLELERMIGQELEEGWEYYSKPEIKKETLIYEFS